MDASNNIDTSVIKKNDPDFPPYLDFELLRKEGISHLGELSGKIWTDHNVHDPGITILEMLCYALIDLGYRTQLPIEDLLGKDPKLNKEDNFFTAAQLLTCNPVTLLDYRKLIIDTPGIRNAWLVVNRDQALYLQAGGPNDDIHELSCQPGGHKICLNGLYDVYLELERSDAICADQKSEQEICEIVEKVKQKLHQYRNLGEDFLTIQVMCQEEIALCGSIDLEADANPEKVTLEIYLALYQFLSPEITFYTLKEMLDRGKTMEEIFAGKPYHLEIKGLQSLDPLYAQPGDNLRCLEQSFGFIDEEELKSIKRRKEIHFSDLYALIGSIKGVRSVERLSLKAFIDGNLHQALSLECNHWIHHLAPNHVPVFCPQRSCLDYTKGGSSRIRVEFETIRQQYREKAAATVRAPLEHKLDRPIPQGRYLPDLGSYYSVQNEFPRNYGIGEGGLSKDATDLRKAQALQLKGYLLFYDQLLANYLGQLSHLRQLFSFLPDSERAPSDRSTQFGGNLETVPQIDSLVRFYTDNFLQSFGWTENTVLALPVHKDESQADVMSEAQFNQRTFNSPAERTVGICQLQREFKQGEYRITVLPDECGYIFTIRTSVEAILLHSKRTYKTQSEAQLAAMTVTFLATLEKAYRLDSDFANNKFSFELVFKPIQYLGFLQSLLEDPESYCRRRNEFLDHLMARFAESFTDYAVLAYGSAQKEQDQRATLQNEIEDKGRFLKNYPLISRNRGKAFNYWMDGWNTLNISGLERRVAALSGIEDWKRQHLCNFEVHGYPDQFNYQITDQSGNVILHSVEQYSTKAAAIEAVTSLIDRVKRANGFSPDDYEFEGKFGILVKHRQGIARYPEKFSNREYRDLQMAKYSSWITQIPKPENIPITQFVFRLQILDHRNVPVKESRKLYKSETESIAGITDFASKINTQLWAGPNLTKVKMELVSIDGNYRFLNILPFKSIDPVSVQYHWALQGPEGSAWLISSEKYPDHYSAELGFVRFTDFNAADLKLEMSNKHSSYLICLKDANDNLMAEQIFDSEENRNEIYTKLERFISLENLAGDWIYAESGIHGWELWDDHETLLQSQMLFHDHRKAQKAANDAKVLSNKESNWEIGKKQDESFRLTLKDRNYVLATAIPGFATREEATLYRQRIRDLWQTQDIIITGGERGYGFTIPQKEGAPGAVLSSYQLYRTKQEALSGIEEALNHARRKKSYYPSGDEANLNFSFLLQSVGSHFLAQHPFTYGSEAERDKALSATLGSLKKTFSPHSVIKEYIYELQEKSGEVLLQSAHGFSTREKAKRAFLEMLPSACLAEHYQKVTSDYRHHLQLNNVEGQLIAQYPYDYIKWEQGDEIINRITALLDAYRYGVHSTRHPHRWKFVYHWEDLNSDWSALLESAQEYSTEEEATKEYQRFLGNFSRVRILEEEVQGDHRLVFKYTGEAEPFAYHPKILTADDAEPTNKAAGDYLQQAQQFQQILAVEATDPNQFVQKIPGRDGGNYVYRMVKKDEYLAYHPCLCGQEPLHEACEQLFSRALAGYHYLEICLGGDITCLLDDKKYHFVLRDQETGKVYFVSYRGYPTAEEAENAFSDLYLEIIDVASEPSNYGAFDPDVYHPILTEEKFGIDLGPCQEHSEPLAVVAHEALQQYGIQQLADLACSFPIRIKWLDHRSSLRLIDGKYHYLVQNRKTDEVYLISYQGYEQPEDAKCAFEEQIDQILKIACIPDNYGSSDQQDTPLILTDEVFNSDFGEENPPLMVVAAPAWEKYGLDRLTTLFCSCIDLIRVKLPDECNRTGKDRCFYFHLVGDPTRTCKLDWKSEQCWDTIAEARETFRLFLNLLKFKGNYYSYQDVEECCCYRLVIREILLESCHGYETESAAWAALDQLLEIICDKDAVHWHWDEPDCKYTIRVVNPDYYTACHPYCYFHPDQAKAVIGKLIHQCSQKSSPNLLSVGAQEHPGELQEPSFTFTISESEDIVLWTGNKSFQKQQHAEDAAWQALSFSERDAFYGPPVKDKIALYQKNKNFQQPDSDDLVALHDAQTHSQQQLIDLALNYPCRKEGNFYYYQVYCEDFEVTEPEEKPEKCQDGKIVTQQSLKQVRGAVVWKSKKQFGSCDEVHSAFQRFCQLVQENSNYQVIETDDCQKYEVVLTDPDQVLACHPQHYTSKVRLKQAIDRIMRCANLEGLHLIEHILLRPEGDHCECPLPIIPDLSCCLPVDLYEDDPCHPTSETEDPTPAVETIDATTGAAIDPESADNDDQPKDCSCYIPGADPYSFWATVVLPCWTKRFRRVEFRETFQELLRKEAPAHVALNIVWVSPRQLCKFEYHYRDWLRWLSCKERCTELDPYCEFIRCLSELRNCLPDTPEDSEACDCNQDQPFNLTNLYINYAFTANRQEVYDPDFINLLGFDRNFDFSRPGNVISLPKDRFIPIFNFPDIRLDQPIPGIDQPTATLTIEGIEQGIRSRLAAYSENLNTIGDTRFHGTEAHQRTKLFLSSPGEPEMFLELMKVLQSRKKRSKSKKTKTRYLNLMQLITGYFIDQQLIRERSKIPPEVRRVLKDTIALLGKEAPKLVSDWKGEDWKTWHQAKAVNAYKRIFRSK